MEHYDIVIVGGGPAGSTLAKWLNPEIGRVLLLEKRPLSVHIGTEKEKPCSGLIAVPAQEMLTAQGMEIPEHVKMKPQELGIRVVDAGSKRSIIEKDRILNVDRTLFENWLHSLIPSRIEVRRNTRFVSYAKVENDGYEVVFDTLEDGRKSVIAKIIVGADGANSKVRRSLPSASTIQKYIGIEWFVNVGDFPMDPMFNIILDAELSDYYLWSVPKGEHLHVGGAFQNKQDTNRIPEKLVGHLNDLGVLPKNFTIDKVWAHPISRACSVNDICFGQECVHLIGEASGLICPTSAEGYSYALSSAYELAKYLNGVGVRTLNQLNRERMSKKLRRKRFIYNPLIREPYFLLMGKKY